MIVENPRINGQPLGYAIRLNPNGFSWERIISIDVPGQRRSWLSHKDAEAINAVTGGALCSLSAGFVCPNKGEKIADNVAAAANIVQWAFLIKSLLASGMSMAAIAIVIKKNPEDIAKIAAETLGASCYKNGDCLKYAEKLKENLAASGIQGDIIRLSSEAGFPIVRAGQTTGEAVAKSGGHHYGVRVGDMVFEMYSTKGVPLAQWAKRYETLAGDGMTVVNPALIIPK